MPWANLVFKGRSYDSVIALFSCFWQFLFVHCFDIASVSWSPVHLQNNSVRYLPGFGPVVPQLCSDCGKKFNMGGPLWSGRIHDQEWVNSILGEVKSMKDRYPAYDRISAVLTTISEVCFLFPHKFYFLCMYIDPINKSLLVKIFLSCEVNLSVPFSWSHFDPMQELPDVPLFLSLHNLCSTLKCTSPSAVMFRSAVINAGYRVSGTHVNPLGLKTDAPMDVIWDIMRCWVRIPIESSLLSFEAPEQLVLLTNILMYTEINIMFMSLVSYWNSLC